MVASGWAQNCWNRALLPQHQPIRRKSLPAALTPNFACENSLKIPGEFRSFKQEPLILFVIPCSEPFCAPDSDVWACLASLCIRHMILCLVTNGKGCYWSQVALVCSSLKQVFGFQPETEAGSWQWEQQILGTRPVVRDQALALQLCSKEFPQRHKVVKQVKCLFRGKEYSTCGETHRWAQRVLESHPCGTYITFVEHFFQFSLASHSDLPGPGSVFGRPRNPPTCTPASLSQAGFYPRGVWVFSIT